MIRQHKWKEGINEGIVINVPVGPLPPLEAYWPDGMALSRLPLASLAETAMSWRI